MTRNPPVLIFTKSHEAHETARVTVSIGSARIGRLYPFSDGRATWFVDLTGDHGTAKSVLAAQQAMAEAFGRWLETAGLVQS